MFQVFFQKFRGRAIAAAAALALGAPMGVQAAGVTLDFLDAEIESVARAMATITGSHVVMDPRVKGTMTLVSTEPLSGRQALALFAVQLRTQGYALVERDGMLLVLPEADAKLQSSSVTAGRSKARSGQISTRIYRVIHEDAADLVPVLRPLISPNNTINVNAGSNSLVITDYDDNLDRLGRIIASLDVAQATDVEIVPLKHAVASDLVPVVARLLESGGGGGAALTPQPVRGAAQRQAAAAAAQQVAGSAFRTTLVPEPRSNAIIVRAANRSRLELARKLIEQLDRPGAASGNIHVVYLKNAEAAKLAVTLRAALAALPERTVDGAAPVAAVGTGVVRTSTTTTSSSGSLTAGPSIDAAGNNQPSTGGQIQADPATNSLIISAPDPVYRQLREVIDKLDQRRAQVFVESLIAEVRSDRAADFGVQWQAIGRSSSGSRLGVIGTNYSTPSAANSGSTQTNILPFAGQFLHSDAEGWVPTVYPNQGFNLLLRTGSLGALASFIQSSGAGNVLSTPTLLTLDNEEAKIVVGQNVPIPTGSYTNTGSVTSSVSPFQTYERQDVGLMLRVRPQISQDGTIKMVIYQEVSDVVQGTMSNISGPTTNKRAIESSVLVDDGSIVVLGGLLEDTYAHSEDKVPGLGSIPVLGNLFRSRSRSYVKTNLMVFLRPVIVRDAAATEAYSLDRYDLLRASQIAAQPEASSVLQVNYAPVMPQLAPTQEPPPGALRRITPPPLTNSIGAPPAAFPGDFSAPAESGQHRNMAIPIEADPNRFNYGN